MNILTKFPVLKKIIDLMKDLKYEHHSIKVGGCWGSWRVHGMGGCGGVGGGGVHDGVGGWMVHGVGAYSHSSTNSYNVKTFHFMKTHPPIKLSLHYCTYTHPHMNSYDVIFHFMNTHPPIKHTQSVTLSLYIYFGWFMGWVVGGGGMVGGFMGWVRG